MKNLNDDFDDGYLHEIHQTEIFTQIIAIISGIASFSVVFILLIRYKILVDKKDFIHYVLLIAIADTMTSIVYSFGFPKPGPLCSIQSFMSSFSARSSWFWSDVLILQLSHLIVYKRHFLSLKYMHMFVWTLNIILEILPFTTNTFYGSNNRSNGICNFYDKGTDDDNSSNVTTWSDATFNGWLYLSFTLVGCCSIFIIIYARYLKFTSTKTALSLLNNTAVFSDAWKTIILYPISMLVAYVPAQSFVLYYNNYLAAAENAHSRSSEEAGIIGNYLIALNPIYGLLLSIIFYVKTQGAREEYIKIIKFYLFNIKVPEIRETESTLSDIEFRTTSVDLPKTIVIK